MTLVSKSLIAAIAVFPVVLASHALAQEAGSQEISVIAPQVTVEQQKPNDSGMMKVLIYTVQRRVSFADLDLRQDADAQRFRQRIRDAAQEGCDQITREHPFAQDGRCVKTATDNAMVQADRVIEAARAP